MLLILNENEDEHEELGLLRLQSPIEVEVFFLWFILVLELFLKEVVALLADDDDERD